jgi:hypothetical protein
MDKPEVIQWVFEANKFPRAYYQGYCIATVQKGKNEKNKVVHVPVLRFPVRDGELEGEYRSDHKEFTQQEAMRIVEKYFQRFANAVAPFAESWKGREIGFENSPYNRTVAQ